MIYCSRCGARNADDARECVKCKGVISVKKTEAHKHKDKPSITPDETKEGAEGDSSSSAPHSDPPFASPGTRRNIFKKFCDWLNDYVGNTGSAELNWRSLFSAVFFPHTRDQAEEIFIAGTASTTPDPKTVSDTWPKPWLYSRIMLWALVTYGLLYLILFGSPLAYPGLVVIGSFAAPIAILVLFIELNVWRNISFYRVTGMFFIGGCASLIATLILSILRQAQPSQELTYISACCVGFTEELAKAIIVLLFMKISLRHPDRILNGMLVGAAVGAGFAAFESAGYAFNGFLFERQLLQALPSAIDELWKAQLQVPQAAEIVQQKQQIVQAIVAQLQQLNTIDATNEVIRLRAWLAPGGHVAWAAILGASFSIIAKTEHLRTAALWDGRFWRLAIIPVVLHAVWDMPFELPFDCKYIGLILGVWTVLLFLVNRGLSEIKSES